MVLKCEIGTGGRKPQVEQYGLDELAASAELVLPGLGPLAAGLARLGGQACGAVTLDAIEALVIGQGRELLCGLVQLGLDAQADAEVRVARVTGADGVPRTRAERGHVRRVVTRLGVVSVRRIGYRSGVRGAGSLFPRDAVLNVPPCGYSWGLQRLAEMFSRSGSYQQAGEFVLAVTGVSIGKRQLEQITVAAAADAERFCQDQGRPGAAMVLPGAGQDRGAELPPLAISADGKGVAMRPEARRRRAKAPDARTRTFEHRQGTGEKGHKRMAETGCVFDVVPPPQPRTPEQVMHPDPGRAGKNAPRSVNRWYACDITAGRDVTIGKVFAEADRRDPGHARTVIVLVDGDIHQIALFQAQAAARGITITILVDFIHVLEYLWKAAWCFYQPRDPAMEDWVTAQGLDILHGRTATVITRIGQLAAEHPPRPGGEHAKIIRKTLHYLDAKQPYLDYPRALAAGWPIATGVIEGACRHLVQDRMGITGARWSLPGAQAILWLRAIHASGDHDTYWDWHIQQEHQRNHLSHYQDSLGLAA
jgi:hypothetical protein